MKRTIALTAVFCLFLIGFLVYQTRDDWRIRQGSLPIEVSVDQGAVEFQDGNGNKETLKAGERLLAGNSGITDVKRNPEADRWQALANRMEDRSAMNGVSDSANGLIPSATREAYWITGFVRDENAQVKSQIPVSLRTGDRWVHLAGTTQTNGEGYYALKADGPGRYLVRADPPENYMYETAVANLTEETRSLSRDFVLKSAPFVIRGIVVNDKTDEPIEGAEITVHYYTGRSSMITRRDKEKSGPDGRFLIRRIIAGSYQLIVTRNGYVPRDPSDRSLNAPDPLRSIQVNESTQDSDIVVRMEPAGIVKVNVKDGRGKPLDRVELGIMSLGSPQGVKQEFETGANGECVIDVFPNQGKYVIRAMREGYGETFSDTFEPGTPDDPTIVVITMADECWISGRVTYQSGLLIKKEEGPAANQEMFASNLFNQQLFKMGAKRTSSNRGVTDEDGEYTIRGLSAGQYNVIVNIERVGTKNPEKTVTLEAGQHLTGVDFAIEAEEEGDQDVWGTVTDRNGVPIANANVTVIAKTWKFATTNAEGAFKLSGFTKDEQGRIKVEAKGYTLYAFNSFTVNGEPLKIVLDLASAIEGIVLDKQTRQPVSGVMLTLDKQGNYNPGQPTTSGGMTVSVKGERDSNTISQNNGTFRFDSIDAGLYDLIAKTEGYNEARVTRLYVEPGQTLSEIVVELERGLELRGVLVDRNGQPVAGATIGLQSGHTADYGAFGSPVTSIYATQVRSEAGGTFTIHNLSTTGDMLVIEHSDYALKTQWVAPESLTSQPLTVVMSGGGGVTGRVVDSVGKPIAGVTIKVFDQPNIYLNRQTATDENGEYRIEHLPASSCVVLKESGDRSEFNYEHKRVAVTEGEFTRVDFGTGEGAVITGTVFDEGKPAPGAYLSMILGREEQDDLNLLARSDDGGNYQFTGVPPGDYVIMFGTQAPEYQYSTLSYQGFQAISITEDRNEYRADLHVPHYEITGTVTDAQTGEPIPEVSIRPLDQSLDIIALRPFYSTTNGEGFFSLKPNFEGDFQLITAKSGYRNREFTIHVRRDVPAEPLSITLERSDTTVKLSLFYRNQPFAGGSVGFGCQKNGQYISLPSQRDPQQGNAFILSGIEQGRVDIFVTSSLQKLRLNGVVSVLVEKGTETPAVVELIETIRYIICLETPGNAAIADPFVFEIPAHPDFARRCSGFNYASREINLFLPPGSYPVTMRVPGYEPITFNPAAQCFDGPLPDGKYVILKLLRG